MEASVCRLMASEVVGSGSGTKDRLFHDGKNFFQHWMSACADLLKVI